MILSSHRALEAVLQLAGLSVQIAVTLVLLGQLDGWLLFLPLAAVPAVVAARAAQRLIEAGREATAETAMLARHLLELAVSPESAQEIRLAGAGAELRARQARLWSEVTTRLRAAQLRAAFAAGELRFSGALDPIAALVVAGAHRADRVMVGGRWVVVDGAIPGLDLPELIARHGAAARALAGL